MCKVITAASDIVCRSSCGHKSLALNWMRGRLTAALSRNRWDLSATSPATANKVAAAPDFQNFAMAADPSNWA